MTFSLFWFVLSWWRLVGRSIGPEVIGENFCFCYNHIHRSESLIIEANFGVNYFITSIKKFFSVNWKKVKCNTASRQMMSYVSSNRWVWVWVAVRHLNHFSRDLSFHFIDGFYCPFDLSIPLAAKFNWETNISRNIFVEPTSVDCRPTNQIELRLGRT